MKSMLNFSKVRSQTLVFVILLILLFSPSKLKSIESNEWTGWGPIVISEGSSSASGNAVIGIDSQNNLHIVWIDYSSDFLSSGTDVDIFYRKYSFNSQTWGAILTLSTESTLDSFFPSIAIDSEDNIHVVWHDNTDYDGSGTDVDIFYKNYDAGIGLWSTTEVVTVNSTANSQYPKIAIGSNNVLHLIWQDYTDLAGSGSDEDILYMTRNTSGQWSNPEVVTFESIGDIFEMALALDSENKPHVVWAENYNYGSSGSDQDIYYKYKNSTGFWTDVETVSTVSSDVSLSPDLALDDSDGVHVVWSDNQNYGSSGTDLDVLYRYKDPSNGWETTEVVSSESDASAGSWVPRIKLDNQNLIHVFWRDPTNYLNAGTEDDVFYKNKGINQIWNPTIVFSVESYGQSTGADFVFDEYNNIHVVFSDPTNIMESGTDIDVWYKVLTNLDAIPKTVTTTQTVTSNIDVTKTEQGENFTTTLVQNNEKTITETESESLPLNSISIALCLVVLPALMRRKLY